MNFDTPPFKLQVESNPNRKLPSFVQSFLVVRPCSDASLQFDDGYVCVRASIRLSDIIKPDFISSFVQKGRMNAVSRGRIDCDDIYAVDPNGRLLMSLGKDTYQLLGLTGDKSKVMESRYMIAFDLLDTTLMKPTSKHYQRLETRLAEFDAYPVHFQITVSKTELPSLMEKYPDTVVISDNTKHEKQRMSFPLPEIRAFARSVSETPRKMLELVDLIGEAFLMNHAHSIPLTMEDAYTKYELDTHLVRAPLINNAQLGDLMTHVESDLGDWAIVFLKGYADAPESYRNKEHARGPCDVLVLLTKAPDENVVKHVLRIVSPVDQAF